jgi:hypothetical protein
MFSYRQELGFLKETLSWSCLFQQVNDGPTHDLPVLQAKLVGRAQHAELPVDRAVRKASGLPMLNVRRQDISVNPVGPSAREELPQGDQSRLGFAQRPLSRRLIVRLEVGEHRLDCRIPYLRE